MPQILVFGASITQGFWDKQGGWAIRIAKKYAPRVIFLGLTPVDENKVDPIPWAPLKSYKNKLINQFLKAMLKFTKKLNNYY